MINLFLLLGIAIILAASTYTALIYGIRLGKAMQKDIPTLPFEPVTNTVKKVYRAVKSKVHKRYKERKEYKKETNIWD